VTRTLIVSIVLSSVCGPAFADSWTYPPRVTSEKFLFGESRIVLEIDGTRNSGYPPHTLLIYRRGELVAKYKNVGFEKVYASADNRYFVGLSNWGIPGTAFVVFDAEGNLLREQKHRFLPDGVHTVRSVTVRRVWYDAEKPAVEFGVEAGRLVSVKVRGSNGQRYDLLAPDLGVRQAEENGG